jgi:hypothetical protein
MSSLITNGRQRATALASRSAGGTDVKKANQPEN